MTSGFPKYQICFRCGPHFLKGWLQMQKSHVRPRAHSEGRGRGRFGVPGSRLTLALHPWRGLNGAVGWLSLSVPWSVCPAVCNSCNHWDPVCPWAPRGSPGEEFVDSHSWGWGQGSSQKEQEAPDCWPVLGAAVEAELSGAVIFLGLLKVGVDQGEMYLYVSSRCKIFLHLHLRCGQPLPVLACVVCMWEGHRRWGPE